MHTNFFLGARTYTFLSMKILFKNLLLQISIKLHRQPFLLKMSLRLSIFRRKSSKFQQNLKALNINVNIKFDL